MTNRQSELLAFLRARALICDVPPSLVEMADAIGVKSKSRTHYLLNELERQGLISREPCRSRSVRVVQPLANYDYARGYRDGLAAARGERSAA